MQNVRDGRRFGKGIKRFQTKTALEIVGCSKCHEKGHMSKECPENKPKVVQGYAGPSVATNGFFTSYFNSGSIPSSSGDYVGGYMFVNKQPEFLALPDTGAANGICSLIHRCKSNFKVSKEL